MQVVLPAAGAGAGQRADCRGTGGVPQQRAQYAPPQQRYGSPWNYCLTAKEQEVFRSNERSMHRTPSTAVHHVIMSYTLTWHC